MIKKNKNKLILILLFFILSCDFNNKKDKTYISEVSYIYDFDEMLINGDDEIYQYFDFYILKKYDFLKKDSIELSSIKIKFPINDTIFSNYRNKKCICIYTHKNDLYTNDTIKEGCISGYKVSGFWKLKIDIKSFEFEGFLSSLERKKKNVIKLNIE